VWLLRFALSPTWLLANELKSKHSPSGRASLIIRSNRRYLALGIVAALVASFVIGNDLDHPTYVLSPLVTGPAAWILFSRCNEIFGAFYADAFDKLDPRRPKSSALAWPTRVRLALNSYLELVLNFAVLFAMCPRDWWQCGAQRPTSFTDLLAYSSLTITTSGGGGFVAKSPVLQLLTSYEVVCGLILLVVSFTIYVGRGLPSSAPDKSGLQDKR
jgi:voltage-gated potassium channel